MPPCASHDTSFIDLIEGVAASASAAGSVEEAMHACVERICRFTGWPVGHVYLAGRHPWDALEPSSVWHLSDPERFEVFRRVTEYTPLPPGVGLPGRVLSSGRPAWVVDVTTDPNFPRAGAARRVGLRGALSFPIPVGHSYYAVVECFSLDAVEPDAHLLAVVDHIGRQLGRIIYGARTQDALRESETRFRSVSHSATDAIVAADREGHIISWNQGAERIFGYSDDEVLGRSLSTLMPERLREMHESGLRRVAEHGSSASRVIGNTVEVVGLRKGGREFPIELSLATWETAEGRFFSGIIRDITERKKPSSASARCSTPPRTRSSRSAPTGGCSWRTSAPTSSSATSASRSSAGRSRSCSPSAVARSWPTAFDWRSTGPVRA